MCNGNNIGETELANGWNKVITTNNQCLDCGSMFHDE